MDVTDEASVAGAINAVRQREGRLDVVVNNAGCGLAAAVEDTSTVEAQGQLDTNFFGMVRVCRGVIPLMRKQGGGLIVNIRSMAGVVGIPLQSFYSASKFVEIPALPADGRFDELPCERPAIADGREHYPGQHDGELNMRLRRAWPSNSTHTCATRLNRIPGGITLVLPSDLGIAMTVTTTLKLPDELKARIMRVAKESGRSAHGFMLEALEREVAREERLRDFVREALAADAAIDVGAAVYGAEEVHAWLEKLATDPQAKRPKPWRK